MRSASRGYGDSSENRDVPNRVQVLIGNQPSSIGCAIGKASGGHGRLIRSYGADTASRTTRRRVSRRKCCARAFAAGAASISPRRWRRRKRCAARFLKTATCSISLRSASATSGASRMRSPPSQRIRAPASRLWTPVSGARPLPSNAVGDAAAAIEAYRRAVALNPALPASWKASARSVGCRPVAPRREEAAVCAATLDGLPPVVVAANEPVRRGRNVGGGDQVRQFLQQHRDHIEAMRLLAQIGMRLDVLDDAEFLLESVLVFAPDYHAARYEYARYYRASQACSRRWSRSAELLADRAAQPRVSGPSRATPGRSWRS